MTANRRESEANNQRTVMDLDELFRLVDVREKGIAQVYEYLLHEHIIEDLQKVSDQLKLTLKRGYKVCSVLRELDLVLVYDRPMKVSLQDPIQAWERLASRTIDRIREEAEAKVGKLTEAMENFRKTLKQLGYASVAKAPVEFVSYDTFDFIFYPFHGERSLLIARGNYYHKPDLMQIFKSMESGVVPQRDIDLLYHHVRLLEVKLLISEEILEEVQQAVEHTLEKNPMFERLTPEHSLFKNLEIRVTGQPFANFTIRDDETLIQPSFDPGMAEMGAFLSKQKETLAVFKEKFESLFSKAIPLRDYARKHPVVIRVDEKFWFLFTIA
ncbi:MAG: hypothetical protein Kow0069_03420 [Promethearchaeota archaeon]